MTRSSIWASVGLHIALLVFAIVGLPFLEPKRVETPAVMPVELVPLSAITSSPTQRRVEPKAATKPVETAKAEPTPPKPEPKPEPPKPAEAAKPEPAPPKPEPPPTPPKPVEAAKPEPAPPKPPEPPKPVEVAKAPPQPDPTPPRPEPPKPVAVPPPEPKPQQQQAKQQPNPPPPRPKPPTPQPQRKEPEKKRDEFAELAQSLLKNTSPKPKPQPEKTDDLSKLREALNSPSAPDSKAKPQPSSQRQMAAAPSLDAPNMNQQLSMSERDAVIRQLEQCWNPPAGAKDARNLIVQIRVSLGPGGEVKNALPVDNGRLGDPFYRAAAESAVRAVRRCSPLKLPMDKYEMWRDTVINFDPREMLG